MDKSIARVSDTKIQKNYFVLIVCEVVINSIFFHF